MIWNEKELREELGADGYEWFVNKATPRIAACVYCQGTGIVTVPNDVLNDGWAGLGKQTKYTKQEACYICYAYVERLVQFVRIWTKNVPPKYRRFLLRMLVPFEEIADKVPIERQQKIIDALRAEPTAGWAFFGPPGTGKTVMTAALYTEQVWKETVLAPQYDLRARKFFPVWRISTKRLLDEHTDWSMHRNDPEPEFGTGTPPPTVTVDKIAYVREHGRTPRLFLEEIDKVRETEARRANLFEIVNAIYDYEGQLVVSSNYTPKEYAEKFGDDLSWRIDRSCKVIDLFKQ
jgi:hypothetical protein